MATELKGPSKELNPERTSSNKSSSPEISVIVPCNHPDHDLWLLLKSVLTGDQLPAEILIVRSGSVTNEFVNTQFNPLTFNRDFGALPHRPEVSIKVCDLVHAYPGEARNIGTQHAIGDLLAFLDVKTIAEKTWLSEASQILANPNVDGVWGNCLYASNSLLSSLVRDAIYGRHPVRSVAGSVFRRQVLGSTGAMIPWTPAGEDGDWIQRVEAHRLSFVRPGNFNHRYEGLHNQSLKFFLRKWWRYYHQSRLLPTNNRDRWLSYGLLYLILTFFAFNWNYQISGLLLGSALVVPHITKIIMIAGPFIYLLLRGIYLPLKRGVPVLKVLPWRFVMLFFVAFTLDAVKTFALLIPRRST